MVSSTALWWIWLLPVILAAPWITAIAGYWRRARLRDGTLPPSAAEMTRRRLWS